jgi:hypothetical protein
MDIYVQHIEQLFHTDCHMLLCNVMDIYVPYIIPQALYMYLALLGACTHQKFIILVLIGVHRNSQVLWEIAASRILPPSRACCDKATL